MGAIEKIEECLEIAHWGGGGIFSFRSPGLSSLPSLTSEADGIFPGIDAGIYRAVFTAVAGT